MASYQILTVHFQQHCAIVLILTLIMLEMGDVEGVEDGKPDSCLAGVQQM